MENKKSSMSKGGWRHNKSMPCTLLLFVYKWATAQPNSLTILEWIVLFLKALRPRSDPRLFWCQFVCVINLSNYFFAIFLHEIFFKCHLFLAMLMSALLWPSPGVQERESPSCYFFVICFKYSCSQMSSSQFIFTATLRGQLN